MDINYNICNLKYYYKLNIYMYKLILKYLYKIIIVFYKTKIKNFI